MLFTQKGINWNDLDGVYKNGTLYFKSEDLGFLPMTNFNLQIDEWKNKIEELVIL